MQNGTFLCRINCCCHYDWHGNSGRYGRMTIPQRGVWKNSVLMNVVPEHQLRQPIRAVQKYMTLPAAMLEPPNKVHENSHIPSHLPGLKKPPGLRPPRASAASDVQTAITRSQKRFIPGTASASAPSAISAGRSAVKGRQ